MSSLTGRSSACALISVALTFAGPAIAGPAIAAPPHARIVARPTPPLGALRTAHVPVMHYTSTPFAYHRLTLQATPIRALPLVLPRTPVVVFPAFTPRFRLDTLLAPLGTDRCLAPRSRVLLAELPTTPFTPVACQRDGGWADSRDGLPTLAPGRNRNALYGRAYSPQRDDAQ